MKTLHVVPVVALGVLAAAAPAGAKNGASGGGATPACVSVASLNSGAVDKPASRKPITVDLQVTNCRTRTATFTTSLVGTTNSLRSSDPYIVEQCATAPYGGQRVSLKAGETRSISAAAQIGYCEGSPWGTSPWGIDLTYIVDYTITVSADGVTAGTTNSIVVHHGGA